MKEIKQIIRDFNYMSCKAANKAIRMWYDHTRDMIDMKSADKSFNAKDYEKKTFGKIYRNVIEGEIKLLMPIANTSNIGTMHQQLVYSNWRRLKKDVLNYKSSLPIYKLNTPYYIKNNNYKLGITMDILLILLFIINRDYQKEGLKLDINISSRLIS